jgi:hypothetical protein
MKTEVSQPMLIGAAVVAVLLIGFLVWKFFGTSDSVDTASIDARIAAKEGKKK